MASQMFWLLSYVSLGLALTLGNRPTSIHSSQQQQKQQSTSSSTSQTQKSRQDHRFSRDPTIVDVGNQLGPASAPEEELDNLRSYKYDVEEADDDSTKDWLERADRIWRDPSIVVRRRDLIEARRDKSIKSNNNLNNNKKGETSSSRDTAFLDEFASAVMDTLYPRHRDFYVAPKLTKVRQNYEIGGDQTPIGYDENSQRTRGTKKSSRTMISQREYPKKISRSPIVVYRNEQNGGIGEKIFDIDKTDERIGAQRSIDDSINYDSWSNDDIDYSRVGSDGMKNNREYGYDGVDSGGNSKMPEKRNQGGGGGGRGRSSNPRGWTPAGQQSPPSTANAGASIASQFLLRSARGNRQYDVPQIECPASEDGMERFACPTPDRMGRYRCIDDHVLCDGFIDCPTAEDEDRQACMFYKTTKAHLDVLADALLRWARGR